MSVTAPSSIELDRDFIAAFCQIHGMDVDEACARLQEVIACMDAIEAGAVVH